MMIEMLHENRVRAQSFGDDPDQYDRARPSYPEAMVDDLMADQPQRVIDVGCGTGIASRQFMRRGCAVLGVEPDERMAGIARRSGVEVEIGHFEAWNAAGRFFDLLVSGQAWHWVHPERGAEKAARVVPPGARIGLFWNRGAPEAPLATAFDEIYRALVPDLGPSSIVLGHMGNDRFEVATAALEATGFFEPIDRRIYGWQARYSRGEWIDLLSTHSDHRTLPPARLHELLDAVGNVIDQQGGSLAVDYSTVLITTVRLQPTR